MCGLITERSIQECNFRSISLKMVQSRISQDHRHHRKVAFCGFLFYLFLFFVMEMLQVCLAPSTQRNRCFTCLPFSYKQQT